MKVNVEEFERQYLADAPLPLALPRGWRVVAVREDRVRWAIDVELTDARGETALAYVERRSQGGPALATTAHLAVCYYPPPAAVDEGALAEALRALTARLGAVETRLPLASLDAIFTTSAVGARSEIAMHPVELRINRECNEACLFCNTPPDSEAILDGRGRVLSEIDRLFELGHRVVTFTGREPTLDPSLEEYIRRCKDRGYSEVRLQTNGTAFSNAEVARSLRAAGLDRVQLSLHTFRASTFATLVGAPRLLEKALAGLENMLATPGLQVEVLCVVTSLNVHELAEFSRRLCRDHAGRGLELVFSPVAPMGEARKHLDLLADFDDLRREISAALRIAADAGVSACIPNRCGMPPCLTPPDLLDRNLSVFALPGSNIEQGKARAPACVGCAMADRCAGAWTHYLDRFGDGSLSPYAALPELLDPTSP